MITRANNADGNRCHSQHNIIDIRNDSAHVRDQGQTSILCAPCTLICSIRNVTNTASEQGNSSKGVQKTNLQPNTKYD